MRLTYSFLSVLRPLSSLTVSPVHNAQAVPLAPSFFRPSSLWVSCGSGGVIPSYRVVSFLKLSLCFIHDIFYAQRHFPIHWARWHSWSSIDTRSIHPAFRIFYTFTLLFKCRKFGATCYCLGTKNRKPPCLKWWSALRNPVYCLECSHSGKISMSLP